MLRHAHRKTFQTPSTTLVHVPSTRQILPLCLELLAGQMCGICIRLVELCSLLLRRSTPGIRLCLISFGESPALQAANV